MLAENLAEDAAQATAANVGRFVEDSRLHVESIARKPGLVGRGREPVEEILSELLEIEPRFAAVALIDGEGRILATASRSRRGSKPLTVPPALLTGMLGASTSFVSEPFRGRISGSWVCVIAARIPPDRNSPATFVGASVDLEKLTPMLPVPRREYETGILVLSRGGRVIAGAPEPAEFLGRDVSKTALGSLLGARKERHAIVRGLDGMRRLYGLATIPATGWTVAVGVPEENVGSNVRNRLWVRLAILIAGLSAGLALAAYGSHVIARPIRALESAADAVARGKTQVPMPIAGPREIRTVGASVRRMTETLRRNERASALGAVVAGVAHEIRGPLFALAGLVDAWATRAGDPAAAERYLPHLRREIRRLTRLSTGLLDYGREQKLHPEPVPLDWLLGAAVEAVRSEADARNVRLAPSTRPGERVPRVLVDRELGVDLLANLIENAVSLSPSGTTVEVFGALHEGAVEIEVLDRGPGIADSDLPYVFEPFFSRKQGGTGVGLALVQRLVVDHGGTIAAENRPDGGACFRVRLQEAK